MCDRVDRKSYLGLRRRICFLETLQEVSEGQIEVFGPVSSPSIVVPSQHLGLCHETQGFFDGLVANLLLVAVLASANPGGKRKEELLLVRASGVPQVRVDAALCCIL